MRRTGSKRESDMNMCVILLKNNRWHLNFFITIRNIEVNVMTTVTSYMFFIWALILLLLLFWDTRTEEVCFLGDPCRYKNNREIHTSLFWGFVLSYNFSKLKFAFNFWNVQISILRWFGQLYSDPQHSLCHSCTEVQRYHIIPQLRQSLLW